MKNSFEVHRLVFHQSTPNAKYMYQYKKPKHRFHNHNVLFFLQSSTGILYSIFLCIWNR